jgi:hypothetical protein
MKKPEKQELIQAAICLLCVIVVGRDIYYLGPSEFSGGHVTGRLFWLADKGWGLLFLALFLTFVFRRAAAGLMLAASLFCWPLYLYLTFPGPARGITGGESSIRLAANFIWDWWVIAGIIALLAMTYVCVRSLLPKTWVTSQ